MEDTHRALLFCNLHLASAPNSIQRALGEENYDWLAWFSGAKTRTRPISSISSISQSVEQFL
jgi:hypothetical protein